MSLYDIQGALADALDHPDAPTAGPLAIGLDHDSDVPGRNYAAPVRPEVPTAQDISSVIAFMRAADRMPRLEFVAPSPELERLLIAAGFAVDHRVAVLVLDVFLPAMPPTGFTISSAPTQEQLLAAAAVTGQSYGDPEPATIGADRLRHVLDSGGFVSVACEDATGLVVGSGLATPPRRGLSELAVVAVREELRRRGLAAAVATGLTRSVLAAGVQPFLQAEDPEVSTYRRLGYEQVGEMVFAELRPGSGPG